MRCRRSSARADREEEGRGRRDDRTVRIIQRYAERFQARRGGTCRRRPVASRRSLTSIARPRSRPVRLRRRRRDRSRPRRRTLPGSRAARRCRARPTLAGRRSLARATDPARSRRRMPYTESHAPWFTCANRMNPLGLAYWSLMMRSYWRGKAHDQGGVPTLEGGPASRLHLMYLRARLEGLEPRPTASKAG